MQDLTPVVAACVTRGEGIDAWHTACIAVVGPEGALSQGLGNAQLRVMTRSAIKPFQALPLILSGAAERLALSDEELALACASHDGSDRQRALAASLLAKAGATVADLRCGAHWPLGDQRARIYPTRGQERDPLRNNCSGKHAGFLALARVLGVPFDAYLDPESEVQRQVKAALAAACALDPRELLGGIDGCSAPNYALPLAALARGMARLATARTESPALDQALGRVKHALTSHPELASGVGRFDFELMTAFGDRLVCKGGAEGLHALGLVDPPLGMAVKILDGAGRAVAPVCLAALDQLGLLDASQRSALGHWMHPELHNLRGLKTGEIVAQFTLTPSAEGY